MNIPIIFPYSPMIFSYFLFFRNSYKSFTCPSCHNTNSHEIFECRAAFLKFLFDFFEFFEEKAAEGLTVKINWNYREDDDTMLEAGEDFAEDMESCAFELVGLQVPTEGEAE